MTRIDLKPLDQQVVVVIGATSGIGRATVNRLADRRARMVLSARSEADLLAASSEALGRGAPDVRTVAGDVASFDVMEQVAQVAMDAFGRIDTWAHIAGVDLWGRFLETSPEEFRRVIDVNLIGVANGLRSALPRIRGGGGGAAIVVSSVEAEVPLPDQSAYAASKHGVNGLVRSIRMELQHDDVPIALTQILPASIGTPLFDVARTTFGRDARPVPPVYDPEVPAGLICHAAEHASRELYAGGFGWLMGMTTKLLPRVAEAVVGRVATPIQRSGPPSGPDKDDNLVAPAVGVGSVRGSVTGRRASVASIAQTTPVAVRAALVALVGILVAARVRRS